MDFDAKYLNLIKSDKKRYEKDYKELRPKVANSKAIFRGEVVPYIYKPLFFNSEDVENFKYIVKMMIDIGDKLVDSYLKEPKVREKFSFPKELEELILLDNGYDINVPMARMDIFYKDRENFKFCEINTDGSSAMLEDNSFAKISLDSLAIKDLEKEGYKFKNYELIDSWVSKSLDIYNSWEYKKVDKPNVAILDLIESATTVEFEEFKKAYENRGLRAEIVDPRELEYKDSKLYYGDLRIDMVYRRLVTFEMLENYQYMDNFLKAYKNMSVCTIGSFRSQLLHNKLIFKVLHDDDILKIMNENERKFIKNHIPYTREFSGGLDIFNHVLENKDKYIMKPSDMNVGRGVYTGRDMDYDTWKKNLEESFNKDYIYQEFVEPYAEEFPVYESDEFKFKKLNPVVGLFSYKEEFSGLYTRLGEGNVVASTNSYRSPNLIVSKN